MSQNNDTKSDIIKYIIGVVIGALFAAAVDVLWVNPTLVKQQVEATKAMEQEAIVQALSKRFEFVDKNSDYEDAIEEVYKAYNEAIKNVAKLEEDNEGLIKQHDETTASNTVDRAKEYAENKEYGLAIDTLNGVSSQTSEITSLIKRYEEKAAEQLEEAAKQGLFLSQEELRNRSKVSNTVIEKMAELGILGDMPKNSQLEFEFL